MIQLFLVIHNPVPLINICLPSWAPSALGILPWVNRYLLVHPSLEKYTINVFRIVKMVNIIFVMDGILFEKKVK